jgi:hypothetical protein
LHGGRLWDERGVEDALVQVFMRLVGKCFSFAADKMQRLRIGQCDGRRYLEGEKVEEQDEE